MRSAVVAVMFTLAGSARADSFDVGLMTATARQLAGEHDCVEVRKLGDDVRALDPGYYVRAFAVDPEIAPCLASATTSTSPIALAAPPFASPTARRTGTPKSPRVALGLSLGATLVAIPSLFVGIKYYGNATSPFLALGAVALLFGPSFGHYYAHSSSSWWLASRLAGAAVVLGGVAYDASETVLTSKPAPPGTGVLVGAGALLLLIGSVGDIATAPSAAHDYNRAHGWEPSITVAPIATPGGAGIGLAGSF